MADDDIKVGSSFDGKPLTDGIDAAAAELKKSTEQMSLDFGEVSQAAENSATRIEAAATEIKSALSDLGAGEVKLAAPVIDTDAINQASAAIANTGIDARLAADETAQFSNSLDKTASSSDALLDNLVDTASATQLSSVASRNAGDSLSAMAEGSSKAEEALGLTAASSLEATESSSLLAEALVEGEAASLKFATSAEKTGESAGSASEATAGASETLKSYVEAAKTAQDSSEVLSTANEKAAEAASAAEKAAAPLSSTLNGTAAAATEAADGANQFNISLGEGVEPTAKMLQLINFLNNQEAVNAATSQEVKAAWSQLAAEATAVGAAVERTATGFQILATSEEEAGAAALAAGEGMKAFGTARMGSALLGVSSLGYGLGILARASAALAPIFAAAFPVIFVVAMVDIVNTLIDRFEKMEDDIVKGESEWNDFGLSIEHSSEQLDLANLKMEDTINKLEGFSSENRLKEALVENTIAAQQLGKQLSDDIEKASQLLTQYNVGFFTGAFTGTAPTGDIKTALKEPLQELGLLVQQQGIIRDALNKAIAAKESDRIKELQAQREEADKDVAAKRAAILASINELEKKTRTEIEAQFKAKQTNVTIGEGLGAATGIGAGGGANPPAAKPPTKEEIEAVNKAYHDRIAPLQALKAAFEGMEAAEKSEAESERLRIAQAAAADAEEKRRKALSLHSTELKNEEALERQHVENAKRAAEQKLREEEAIAEKVAAETGKTDEERLQAEINSVNVRLTLHKNLNSSLLGIEEQRYNAMKSILAREQADIERYEVGEKRINDLSNVQTAMTELEKSHKATQLAITSDYNTQVVGLEKSKADKTRELHNKEIADQVKQEEEKISATKSGSEARQEAEKQFVEAVGKLYGFNTSQYFSALANQAEEHRRYLDQELKDEQEALRNQEALRTSAITARTARHEAITPELQRGGGADIAFQKDIENQLYEAKRESLEQQAQAAYASQTAELDDYKNKQQSKINAMQAGSDDQKAAQSDLDAFIKAKQKDITDDYAKQKDKEVVLTQEHAAKIKAIEDQRYKDQINLINSVDSTMQRAESQMLVGLVTNYKTFAEGLRGLWTGLLQDWANFLAKKLQMWIETHILMKIWSKLFGLHDDTTDNTKKIAQNRKLAESNAGVAADETLATEVPKVGPWAAAAEAAAIMAYGTALANAGTAAKGAVLEHDMPIFAHAQEMILPANISVGMQNLINHGTIGSAQSAGSGVFPNMPMHFNIHGQQDPQATAKLVSDMVFARVQRYFRNAGVQVK